VAIGRWPKGSIVGVVVGVAVGRVAVAVGVASTSSSAPKTGRLVRTTTSDRKRKINKNALLDMCQSL
jgi:hypothetical protein